MRAGVDHGAIDRAVGLAGRAMAEGRAPEAAERLAGALAAARAQRHPRTAEVARLAARALLLAGRASECLEVLGPAGTGGPTGDGLLRAGALEALGRAEEALAAWSEPSLEGSEAALDGRVRCLLALDRAADALALLQATADAARSDGRDALALRCQAMAAPLLLEAGRTGEALAAWDGVAEGAAAAGEEGLGLQALAQASLQRLERDDGRDALPGTLAEARDRAVALGDPAAYALVCTALALGHAAAGRDAEAVGTALRAQASLRDLLGEAGAALGDALVRRASGAMGAPRWDAALQAFVASGKAGEAQQHV